MNYVVVRFRTRNTLFVDHVKGVPAARRGEVTMSEKEKLLPPTATRAAIQPADSGRILTRRTSDTRLTTVTYSVAIALMGSLLFGFAIGYSSPVISDLQGKKNGTKESGPDFRERAYLYKTLYQGIFSVRCTL